MLNILQVEDRLKDMSQEAVMEALNNPNPVIPPFMALAELNRRKRMNDDLAMRQAQNQQTVKDQVVAGAGMPMEMASEMATAMAPKSDIAGNTGIEAMMQRDMMPSEYNDDMAMMDEDIMQETPMSMKAGGLIAGGPNKAASGLSLLSPIYQGIRGIGQFGSKFLKPKPKVKSTGTDIAIRPENPLVPYKGPPVPSKGQVAGTTGAMTLASMFASLFDGDKKKEEEPQITEEDDIVLDDPVPEPVPDPTFQPTYIPQIMAQLDKDRAEVARMREQQENLGLAEMGLRIADRGFISDAVEGLPTITQANKDYIEGLSDITGTAAQAGISADTLAQRSFAAQLSYDKAIELAKMMGGGDLIKGIDTIGDQIALLGNMIQTGYDIDGETILSPEQKLNYTNRLKRLNGIQDLLVGKLGMELGTDVIKVDK